MKKLLLVGLVMITTILGLAQKYEVVNLGTLGGDASVAYAINNSGQIVGLSLEENGNFCSFIYSNGVMKKIGTQTNGYSFAFGINRKGYVVGVIQLVPGQDRAFLYKDGLIQDLESLGGQNISRAYGINDMDQVVGWASGNSFSSLAFSYSNGSMQALSNIYSEAFGVNNSGQIVGGHVISNGNYYAFLYSDGSMKNLGSLGGFMSKANNINDMGEIVGFSYIAGDLTSHAFIYSNQQMLDLGTLGGARSEAKDINNSGKIVGNSQLVNEDYNAFLFSDGVMHNLNNLIATNLTPGWTVIEANGINDSGQIVGLAVNSQDESRAVLLNPLPEGWEETITNQPDPILYGALPDRMEGETNLVLITHGNNPDLNWLRNLTNTIGQELQGIPGWRVASYEWEERANHPLNPGKSLSNAIEDGLKGGRKLATNGWEHIHMIAHSAGSGFIEYATRTITNISPNVVVHTTFLDAFVGYLKGQENEYGASSDWSDSYITKTAQPFTRSILPNTYSVDVTDLDQVTHDVPVFLDWYLSPCTETVADHGWPYRFYSNTVTGAVTSEYKGFGYPLSKEGGGYDLAKMLYPKGGSTNLGIPPTCNESILEGDVVETPVSPSTVPSYKVGTVLVNTGAIELRTASPSLISLALYLTNDADTVNFEARYTTTNANPKGLLTSYWDTNILGQLDEEAVLPGLQRYTYKFPMSSANSTHMLSFRIDPFTNVSSSIIITNVTYGLSGPREDFTLSVTTNTVGGKPVFELKGDAGFAYSLEASTNLINWETIAKLANTNGTVRFYDPSPSTYGQRFYRAVVPR